MVPVRLWNWWLDEDRRCLRLRRLLSENAISVLDMALQPKVSITLLFTKFTRTSQESKQILGNLVKSKVAEDCEKSVI